MTAAGIELGRYSAVLFDLDGVLTATTSLHASCWKQALDPAIREWVRRTGRDQPEFDIRREYVALLDGKPRADGVRDFLCARGIDAPAGFPSSSTREWSVHGIANRKQALVERALAGEGVEPFPGSVRWVEHLRRNRLRTAVVSSSANSRAVLRAAGIAHLFDVTVDGHDVDRLGLRGKPAPDSFLEASARLAVHPVRTVVVEDALAGVAAARAGRFGLVIGVVRNARRAALLSAGAHMTVDDLGELV